MDSARRCALHTAGAGASRGTLLRAWEPWNERMSDGEAGNERHESGTAGWNHRAPGRGTAGLHAREQPAPDHAILGATERRFQDRRLRDSGAGQPRLMAAGGPVAEPWSMPVPWREDRMRMPPGRERLLNGTRGARDRHKSQAYNERQRYSGRLTDQHRGRPCIVSRAGLLSIPGPCFNARWPGVGRTATYGTPEAATVGHNP